MEKAITEKALGFINFDMRDVDEDGYRKEGDYFDKDGLLVCGVCHESKQCFFSFLGSNRVVRCICKCEVEKDKAEKERQKKIDLSFKVKELRKTGFPESDMQKWCFANDDMENPKITQVMRRYVDNFDLFFKQGKGLLLFGPVGTGKTFAACEVANALIDKGHPTLVTNFARLINTIQETFEKQTFMDSLNRYDLLVIDDLGVERDTAFAREQVFNIIDARYRASLPMIITTNLSFDKLKKPDATDNERIYDRILERCVPVQVVGASRRIKTIRKDYASDKDLLGL